MSSSPPNVRLTKGERLEVNSPGVLPCPECGNLAMTRVRGTCTLRDGTVIPNLERFQCQHCQANFFDDAAMRTVGKSRQQNSRSKSIQEDQHRSP
jgi:hypothetical protein